MTSILPPMLHSSTAPRSCDTADSMSEKNSGFSSVPWMQHSNNAIKHEQPLPINLLERLGHEHNMTQGGEL